MYVSLKTLSKGMYVFILPLLAACAPWPHTEQHSYEFESTVYDAETHAPIEGATIALVDDPGVSCTSDKEGRFRLKATHNFKPFAGDDGGGRFTDKVIISHPNYTAPMVHALDWGGDIPLEPAK